MTAVDHPQPDPRIEPAVVPTVSAADALHLIAAELPDDTQRVRVSVYAYSRDEFTTLLAAARRLGSVTREDSEYHTYAKVELTDCSFSVWAPLSCLPTVEETTTTKRAVWPADRAGGDL